MADNVKFNGWSEDEIENASRAALLAATNQIKNACDKIIPLDQGTLRDSGRIIRDAHNPICYIKWDTPYARRQWYGEYRHANGRMRMWGVEAAIRESANITKIVGKVFADTLRGTK